MSAEKIIHQIYEQIDVCSWSQLSPHLKNDLVFMVGRKLDLVEVAKAMIQDEVDLVKQWVSMANLRQPTAEEIELFNAEPIEFYTVRIHPYYLIKPCDDHMQ